MQTYYKQAKTVEQHAQDLLGRGILSFQSKEMRNAVAKVVKTQGRKVRVSSSRNQQVHPEYIADYVGEIETGFGNTMYRTFFRAIYTISLDQGF